MANVSLKIEGPKKAKTCVVLTHGAGESSASTFLSYFAKELVARRHRVVRFDFPYMEERSTKGRRRPPDKEEVLLETWRQVLRQLKDEKIVIGGKSMGGRMATMIADECGVDGVLCLGYPFHPTGRPEKLRIDHLQTLTTPTLIIQGEQDPFGSQDEVTGYSLSESVQIHWVPDGDHAYNVSRGSDRAHEQNLKNALRSAETFLFELWAT
ncbi:MAG TPA: alpha/beta fold hydrolase [Planctomicrobium sp.]|nr:alpha/beta fold hydrolase [Planctomicrobium sp.]